MRMMLAHAALLLFTGVGRPHHYQHHPHQQRKREAGHLGMDSEGKSILIIITLKQPNHESLMLLQSKVLPYSPLDNSILLLSSRF